MDHYEKAPQAHFLRGVFLDASRARSLKTETRKRVLIGAILIVLSGGEVAAKTLTPLERVATTPKGQLKSPYPDYASVAEEGRRIYSSFDCGGCHGGGGGGGMAAPLTNEVWIYGDDDDTLI